MSPSNKKHTHTHTTTERENMEQHLRAYLVEAGYDVGSSKQHSAGGERHPQRLSSMAGGVGHFPFECWSEVHMAMASDAAVCYGKMGDDTSHASASRALSRLCISEVCCDSGGTRLYAEMDYKLASAVATGGRAPSLMEAERQIVRDVQQVVIHAIRTFPDLKPERFHCMVLTSAPRRKGGVSDSVSYGCHVVFPDIVVRVRDLHHFLQQCPPSVDRGVVKMASGTCNLRAPLQAKREPCMVCAGMGKLPGTNGKSIKCGGCAGQGHTSLFESVYFPRLRMSVTERNPGQYGFLREWLPRPAPRNITLEMAHHALISYSIVPCPSRFPDTNVHFVTSSAAVRVAGGVALSPPSSSTIMNSGGGGGGDDDDVRRRQSSSWAGIDLNDDGATGQYVPVPLGHYESMPVWSSDLIWDRAISIIQEAFGIGDAQVCGMNMSVTNQEGWMRSSGGGSGRGQKRQFVSVMNTAPFSVRVTTLDRQCPLSGTEHRSNTVWYMLRGGTVQRRCFDHECGEKWRADKELRVQNTKNDSSGRKRTKRTLVRPSDGWFDLLKCSVPIRYKDVFMRLGISECVSFV